MVQLEQHYNVNHSVPKNTESEVRRILPEVPKQPLPPPPPLATQYEPDIVPKPKIASKPPGVQDRVKAAKGETPPEPAPRSSLIEDQARIEVETPKKEEKCQKA